MNEKPPSGSRTIPPRRKLYHHRAHKTQGMKLGIKRTLATAAAVLTRTRRFASTTAFQITVTPTILHPAPFSPTSSARTRTRRGRHAFFSSLKLNHNDGKHSKTTSTVLYAENNSDGFSELSSALAKLDRQWQIQQREKPQPNQWTQLFLEDDSNESRNQESSASKSLEDEAEALYNSFARTTQQDKEFVYLLEAQPVGSLPSSVILFLGGAVLGQFPHLAYGEFLRRVGERMGAAVIAVPYEVGLDHFEIAKACERLSQKALSKCQAEKGWNEALPQIVLAHSLGAKLSSISLAATSSTYMPDDNYNNLQGVGYLSYNNYGLVDSIDMAASFARNLTSVNTNPAGSSTGSTTPGFDTSSIPNTQEFVDMLVNVAKQATVGLGMEFRPSPAATEQMLRLKFGSGEGDGSSGVGDKIRLFTFEEDKLDNSEVVFRCLTRYQNEEEVFDNAEDDNHSTSNPASSSSKPSPSLSGGGRGPSVSALPGSHLTPVYISLGLDRMSETAQTFTKQVTEFRGASFGNEEDLAGLVDEVCAWIVGKGPGQQPGWSQGRKKEVDGVKVLPGGDEQIEG